MWIGAQDLLSAADRPLALITEAQFHEMRGRRGTVYGDIDRLMRDRGYRLADLDIHRYTRAALPGHFAIDMFAQTKTGAVQACDAVYVLDPVLDPIAMQDLLDRNDPRAFLKLIVLYDTFNLQDYAAALLIALRERGMSDVAGLPIAEALDMLVPERNVLGAKTYEDYIRSFESDPRQLLPARLAAAAELAAASDLAERPGPRDWTLDMSVGEGCLKKGRTITSPKGVEGHMVFGPCASRRGRLCRGGRYLRRRPGEKAGSAGARMEIVVDEKVIDTLEIPLGNEGRSPGARLCHRCRPRHAADTAAVVGSRTGRGDAGCGDSHSSSEGRLIGRRENKLPAAIVLDVEIQGLRKSPIFL